MPLGLLATMPADVALVHHELDTVEYEVLFTERRCELCGRPADPITDRAATMNPRGRRWICNACIRAYVPGIQAKLDDPWWQ